MPDTPPDTLADTSPDVGPTPRGAAAIPSTSPPVGQAPKPALHRFGRSEVRVMTLDGAGPAPRQVISLAEALMPFPPASQHYPGLRRYITSRDAAAHAYVTALLHDAAPYLGGAFDIDGFDLVEASFSVVTTSAAALTEVQRKPHFDVVDPHTYAILHYLNDTPGTAFYRHRASNIECMVAADLDRYIARARAEIAPAGYICGSDPHYECIGSIEGRAGRLVAYPAHALHSGMIPADFVPGSDPVRGRLTANIFIRG